MKLRGTVDSKTRWVNEGMGGHAVCGRSVPWEPTVIRPLSPTSCCMVTHDKVNSSSILSDSLVADTRLRFLHALAHFLLTISL